MKTKRLLVIDDNDQFILLIKLVFEYDNDWQILTASNVKDGISLAQIYQPHVILLDVEMPGQNGFDGYKMLKKNWATRLVPIIFVTGMEGVKHKIKSYISEEVDIIMKPVNIIKLKDEVIKTWEHNFVLKNK